MVEHERMPLRAGTSSNATILVVASDPKFLKVVDMALQLEFECEILPFTRAKRAIEMSEHARPDLFIFDYHLLDLSALELSLRLHTLKELESVPTIVLNAPVTSWSENQSHRTLFLTTPFSLGDLYAAVKKCFWGHLYG